MTQKPLYPKADIIFYIFIVIVLVALTLDAFWLFDKLYVHRARMDDSRLILANISPWVNGTFTFSDLWNDHHPAPFAGIMYILSYEFESLNFRLWKFFIGFAILLEVAAFSWLTWSDNALPHRAKSILILTVFLVLMNGNSSIRYEWNLVGMLHFYFALAVPLLLSLKMLVRKTNWKSLVLFTFFALLNIIVFRSFALFFLVSIFGVILLRFIFLKLSGKKLLLSVMASIFTALLIEKVIYQLLGIELYTHSISADNILTATAVWGADPINALSYILTALATGIMNPGYLVKAGISSSAVNISWLLVGIIYFTAMVIATCRIKNSQYITPLIIMGTCTLMIIAAMILRVQSNHIGMYTSYWPRYIPMRDFGFIGVFWVAALEFQKIKKWRFTLTYLLTPIVISGLLALAVVYHYYDHQRSNHVKATDHAEQQAMIYMGHYLEENDKATFRELIQSYRQQGKRMPTYFTRRINPNHNRHNNIDLKGIYFLKENSKNVFSENFPIIK